MAPPSPSPPPSGETTCKFGQCFCQWRTYCSPRILSVVPGRDYENMPAGGADDDDRAAAWSVLVGYFSYISRGESLLRLHRFRVARSGRVLGRSGDALEICDDVEFDYEGKDASSYISYVCATPGPDADGRSLCLFCREIKIRLDDRSHIASPRPFQLNLNLGAAAADRGVTVCRGDGVSLRLVFSSVVGMAEVTAASSNKSSRSLIRPVGHRLRCERRDRGGFFRSSSAAVRRLRWRRLKSALSEGAEEVAVVDNRRVDRAWYASRRQALDPDLRSLGCVPGRRSFNDGFAPALASDDYYGSTKLS